jgi:hypothetical protein
MKTLLIALAAGLLTVTTQAQQNSEQVNDIVFLVNNTLTSEQQALMENGKWMQMYSPGEHSRCFTTRITATRHGKNGAVHEIENPESVLVVVFGVEDATPARNQAKEMAQNGYSAAEADKFLFAQGYEKYHGNRFFTCPHDVVLFRAKPEQHCHVPLS